MFRRTKIVATVGPASEKLEQLIALIQAGVDVFRVNTSHGTTAEHQRRVELIREASAAVGCPVGILADLPGPKMRLGEIPGGPLQCTLGSVVKFVRGEVSHRADELVTTYPPLIDELRVGARVLLADGTVVFNVEGVEAAFATCRVVQGGLLRSRQGVNLPGLKLSAAALGPDDRVRALWAAQAGVDFLGLSFVRAADDVRQLKALLAAANSSAQVIAKIEKPEAVADLENIVAAADGIMVARGDLGVETDIAELPIVQKRILATCHQARKPVIVATQMLDSMQHSRLPTRAEVNDVANAILDGADACMLSGETAIGEYPVESVEMMHRIALATEPLLLQRTPPELPVKQGPDFNPITEATTRAAGHLATELNARLLIVASATGKTALSTSKHRHFVPTIGVSDTAATLRRMCLYWGVIPLAGAPTEEPSRVLGHVAQLGREAGWVKRGDRIVLVFGTGIHASRHNAITVYEVSR